MVILRTLLVCLIIALILWGIYATLRSILSNKWLHDEARQDVVHLFNQDLPKWLEAAYTALNQHLQTQGSKCDWSIEITCSSHAVIDRCRINFSGSQGIILDSANQQLFYYKTKNLPELHVLQCTNAHPLEAFECFSLPYSDILRAQLITSKHAYTQMKTKGGISQDAAEQHAAGQTVYDKLAIVIQSKNPYHPYIELDFSNHTAVSEMWKSLQTSSILGNIFETETKFSISYAGCDTDIKIRKRFSAIPSLPFALTSIGPAQLNMLNQTLMIMPTIAASVMPESDTSPSASVTPDRPVTKITEVRIILRFLL